MTSRIVRRVAYHIAYETIDLLQQRFPEHIISRNTDVNWPTRSLTLRHFFLLGVVKSRVYVNNPRSNASPVRYRPSLWKSHEKFYEMSEWRWAVIRAINIWRIFYSILNQKMSYLQSNKNHNYLKNTRFILKRKSALLPRHLLQYKGIIIIKYFLCKL